jgi:serine protease
MNASRATFRPSVPLISLLYFAAFSLPLGCRELAAQETMEVAGRVYRQQDNKWFVEAQGKRYELNPRVVTVKFKRRVEAAAQRDLFAEEKLSPLRSNRLGYIDLEVPEGANVLEYVKRLAAKPNVESAEVNTLGVYWPVMTPNDPRFPDQWHLPKTNVAPNPSASAWDLTTGSPGIIVAVLDSGTDIGHEDLIGNIWVNPKEDIDGDRSIVPANADHLDNDDKNGADNDSNGFVDDLCGWDFFNNNNNVRGPFFHGTHVAGIVGAMTNNAIGVAGVAGGFGSKKGTTIMPLGVGDSFPDGSILDDAIIYAADNGARIITLSLSVAPSAAIDAALAYAYNNKGVFIDNAAGNTGGGSVGYPATDPHVVAVSSVDMTDTISGFSAQGPKVELSAPGEEIWSTQLNDTYNHSQGTSFASPQVAGLAALLLACDSSLTNERLRQVMQTTAVDLGSPGRDDLYGFGRIDALAALQAVRCQKPPVPCPPCPPCRPCSSWFSRLFGW